MCVTVFHTLEWTGNQEQGTQGGQRTQRPSPSPVSMPGTGLSA